MSTTTAASTPTLRDVIPEHMGPVLAIVDRLDSHKDVNAGVARAIAALAMNVVQVLDDADPDHGIRQNPANEEWWEAEALCIGIAATALIVGAERCKHPGPDRYQAFLAMGTCVKMIRTRWLSGE